MDQTNASRVLRARFTTFEACGIEFGQVEFIIEKFQPLEGGQFGMVASWIKDVVNALDLVRESLEEGDEAFWERVKTFKLNLPEVKELEERKKEVLHLWIKKRPGIIPLPPEYVVKRRKKVTESESTID
jgi:hypothetical protein